MGRDEDHQFINKQSRGEEPSPTGLVFYLLHHRLFFPHRKKKKSEEIEGQATIGVRGLENCICKKAAPGIFIKESSFQSLQSSIFRGAALGGAAMDSSCTGGSNMVPSSAA